MLRRMHNNLRLKRLIATLLVLIMVSAAFPAVTSAEALDWDVANGHLYTQAGAYAVLDKDGVPFWSEFQRLGGVQAVGYPISRRFQWNGFTVQAMQRVVFQWRPEAKQAYFVNTFDLMTQAGKDSWLLSARQTPKPLPDNFDGGKSWDDVVQARLALLEDNPAIKKQYFSVVGDPVLMNGLPTSKVMDMGNNFAIRTQRVVIQQWKSDVPWAAAGQVTVALGGSIAAEAGLLPKEALLPEASGSPVLSYINYIRALVGAPPARENKQLMQAAQMHVAYYDANRGDPSLAGMGLHDEKAGQAGFTGRSFGDRAKAAGYTGGIVNENAGFGGLFPALDWYMNTALHRITLIHPSAVDIGYAESDTSGFNIIDFGLTREKITTALPVVYPPAGSTEIPTSWDGGESPNPAPGFARPLGYPINVAFAIYQQVAWNTFELKDAVGAQVDIHIYTKAWDRTAAIIPLRPLTPGVTYTATVNATVDGKPFKKEWSFTTRGAAK